MPATYHIFLRELMQKQRQDQQTLLAPENLMRNYATFPALSLGFHEDFCVFILFFFPELPSPKLTSNTSMVRMGQSVFLFCSIKNTSLRVNYSLFLYDKQLKWKEGGEAVVFTQMISNANESGPYKCKVQAANSTHKYSKAVNFTLDIDSCPLCLLPLLVPVLLVLLAIILILVFWIRPKYKARKAPRVKGPTDSGTVSLDSDLYANTYHLQPRSESAQEIHYTTPVFQEMSTWKQEAYQSSETRSVYCELNFSDVKN
ncbi:allergin-1 [Perognathus longimembris pacificus]|uniref:allergin-1 n=1 Tax=Perognathus longimembris pacificus TaxID=214514 RepID=UPI002018980F|nr:allergin-1 [Perognathus longimembris pacificus]